MGRWDRIGSLGEVGGEEGKGRGEKKEGGEMVSLGLIALEILGEGRMMRESFWSDLISRLPIHADIQQCSCRRIMLIV